MSNKFKIGDKITVDISDTVGEIYAIDEESGKKIYAVISDETGGTIECTEDRLKHVIIKDQEEEPTFEEIKQLKQNKEEVKNNKTHPSHYKNQSIETIDMMVRIWGAKAVVLFCEINAFKYRMRVGSKEGESIEDDIKKAQ